MEILAINKSAQRYYEYPLHQHNCWEIIFSLDGKGTIRIDDEIYPFSEGTIIVIAPWTPHCKSAPNGFIDGCILINNLPPLDEKSPLIYQDDGSLQTLFQLAFHTQLKNESNSAQIVSILGDAIYQILLNSHAHLKRENPAITKFRQTLLDNVSNCSFDLTAAMKEAGYNDSYMRKLFRETMGSSPLDYFNRLRIDYAKRQLLLYHAVRTIKEIAASAGFSDPYYFSRLFRKYEGKSPSQYIKELGDLSYELLAQDLGENDPEARRFRR